jgi:Uma2 family endonuclease
MYVRIGCRPEIALHSTRRCVFAPDLAVEVASPNQFRPEMAAKAQLYLQRGVRLVWVVWSADRQIDVWHPGSDEPVVTLGTNDHLDGGDVLPGFTHPVADLFG